MIKANYVCLSLAISYLIVAFIQWSIPGVLPASVYVTVSFVSLELSLFELIKTLAIKISSNIEHHNKISEEYICLLQSNVDTFSLHKNLLPYYETYKKHLHKAISENVHNRNQKKLKYLNKGISILSCLQIVFCIIQFVIIPLKFIPYDTLTNKTLNILSLISFALLFFSYYVNSIVPYGEIGIESQFNVEKNISDCYLNIIKNINNELVDENDKSK